MGFAAKVSGLLTSTPVKNPRCGKGNDEHWRDVGVHSPSSVQHHRVTQAPWQILPKRDRVVCMSTMNISLPDSLKEYVDEQVGECGYGTSSEYVRELIRKDQDRKRLRAMILQGATSGLAAPVDEKYFEALRARVRTSRK